MPLPITPEPKTAALRILFIFRILDVRILDVRIRDIRHLEIRIRDIRSLDIRNLDTKSNKHLVFYNSNFSNSIDIHLIF